MQISMLVPDRSSCARHQDNREVGDAAPISEQAEASSPATAITNSACRQLVPLQGLQPQDARENWVLESPKI